MQQRRAILLAALIGLAFTSGAWAEKAEPAKPTGLDKLTKDTVKAAVVAFITDKADDKAVKDLATFAPDIEVDQIKAGMGVDYTYDEKKPVFGWKFVTKRTLAEKELEKATEAVKNLYVAAIKGSKEGLNLDPTAFTEANKLVAEAAIAGAPGTIDAGHTAWMLVSSALVLLMVPGLALFYAGMVRRKNVLGTMMHSMVALSIIGLQWVAFGYSLAFGTSIGGYIGWSPEFVGLSGVWSSQVFPATGIPIYLHCMFQGMFAIITPALISGALAERIKFLPYCLFVFLWGTLIYCPLAHWVWAVDATGTVCGWIGKMGALDFAGGTVVHIAAGMSGLAAILILRRRAGYPQQPVIPNSLVLTLTGAGLLWFGWFGFNGGSALGSNGLAVAAFTATQVAAAAAGLSWILAEWVHRGRPTGLGLASGIVAGLVAVTPAAGFVTPLSAIIIGLLAGVVCYIAVSAKPFLKYDDSLDAFGVHGVGGLLGAILTGVFANAAFYTAGSGVPTEGWWALTPAGGPENRMAQITVQLIACGAAMAYAFVGTAILIVVLDNTIGFCLVAADETEGLDVSQHGEVGFDLGGGAETMPETSHHEPRSATKPPASKVRRFTVILEGSNPKDLMTVWSGLCQTGPVPPPAEFKAVYPFVTTVVGNRFRCSGGDPTVVSANLERLFASRLNGAKIRTKVEEG